MSLAEFLRARLDEDEAVARAADVPITRGPMPLAARQHCSRHAPARVLAEVDAKRFVVDTLRSYEPSDEWDTEPDMGKRKNNAAGALRRMALPYADHPDYDEEWKP